VTGFKSVIGRVPIIDGYVYRNKCIEEANRILAAIRESDQCVIDVIYDHLSSPATLGDFIEVVMFARWFAARGNSVRFVVISGEYRSDMSVSTDHISREVSLARVILERFPSATVAQETWKFYSVGENRRSGVATITPFIERIVRRQDIYTITMGVLNELNAREPDVANSWLLGSDDFPTSYAKSRPPIADYLAWNVRFNPQRDIGRNTSDDDFLHILNILKSRFPDLGIVVVSDEVACEHFRALAGKTAEGILFAADLGQTFEEHAAVVLNAAKYFQFGGGGMGEVAIYSRSDYILYYTLSKPRRMWRKDEICSWQASNQVFHQISISDTAILTFL